VTGNTLMIRVRFPSRTEIFLFYAAVTPPTLLPIRWARGIERPEQEADTLSIGHLISTAMCCVAYQGPDKSLARPGRKQARNHVWDARDFNNFETRAVIRFFFFGKTGRRRKFTPF